MMYNQHIKQLNELSRPYDFVYVLTKIIFNDFIGTSQELFSKNVFEHLNHNELCFLVGLWLKNVDSELKLTGEAIEQIETDVYDLMEKLHYTFLEDFFETLRKNTQNFEDKIAHPGMLKEAMFYSSDGAYDEQYLDLASIKFKYDKDWLIENRNVNIDYFKTFYENIKIKIETKLNKIKFKKDSSIYNQLLEALCLSKEEITGNDIQLIGILKALTVEIRQPNNENFKDLGDFNIFKERPIIKINHDKYFIPSLFAISESLYESPFYWISSDKNYSAKAFYNRGLIAEEVTKKLLLKIYSSNSIFQNVIINRTKTEQLTDIDILTVCGNSGIIFQIKSKKLTTLSKNGNLDSIKKDFKLAVHDAIEQGNLSRECLLNHNNYKFSCDNPDFDRAITNVKEYYIVTIVLDNYPGLTHQTHTFLNGFKNDLPITINIFDLEILIKYLKTSDNFLDYIARRTKFSKKYKAENEMGFLAYHLKHTLKDFDGDIIALDHSWGQSIDQIYYSEKYQKKERDFQNKKFGRNDSCPCRSGFKHKKCCGKV